MITAKFRTPRQMLQKTKPFDIDINVVNKLISVVAKVCNIDEKLITKKGRYRQQVLARNMCFYFLHVHYNQKSAQIAPYFNRDRTTVLHGINTFLNDTETIQPYLENYYKVKRMLKIPKL